MKHLIILLILSFQFSIATSQYWLGLGNTVADSTMLGYNAKLNKYWTVSGKLNQHFSKEMVGLKVVRVLASGIQIGFVETDSNGYFKLKIPSFLHEDSIEFNSYTFNDEGEYVPIKIPNIKKDTDIILMDLYPMIPYRTINNYIGIYCSCSPMRYHSYIFVPLEIKSYNSKINQRPNSSWDGCFYTTGYPLSIAHLRQEPWDRLQLPNRIF